MGSKALLIRYANRLTSNNQLCKNISSSAALSEKVPKVEKALSVHEPPKKSADTFFSPQGKLDHDKALQGYITIQSEVNAVGIVSGVPEEHIKTRTVRIYKPPKNAMQSGTDNTHGWQISFDTRERWENQLMGWCSSGDPLQALRVNFDTEEEAIKHCENMGWKYFVQKPNVDDPKPRSYGANFSWDKRTRVSTK